jgi:hypothetical protein
VGTHPISFFFFFFCDGHFHWLTPKKLIKAP